ncbi:DC-STAMP domain-containing protein 2-like [Anopheles cruzii]|uniref:DC-STAMP domain-containing protein 2-like n=1 Tax=Anopheles cruzii TaxID=68878 RepID=UPI0022EC335C|nr:DC-STAMP domain-containing protein 2-like [Anopheles cruzii]
MWLTLLFEDVPSTSDGAKSQENVIKLIPLQKGFMNANEEPTGAIKKAYDWLRDVVAICNDQLGSPSQRCLNSLDKTIDGCKEEMGSMDFLCEVTQVAKSICYGATMVDYFCELIDFVSDSIVDEIEQGIQQLMQYMEDLFRVKVEYDHAYDFATNASKSFAEIRADIRAEIAQRTLPLRRTFNLLGVVTSGFFICILIRAIQYHEAFLERDEFDNIFLTKEFYEIEKRRGELNMEPLLPLTRKERHRYVPVTSLHLTWKERLRIAKSATFLLISTVQIACQLFSDYALYWLLTLIKQFMHQESNRLNGSGFGSVGVAVRGDGILADTLRDIVRSFDPIVNGTVIDPSQCIPEALPPRFGRYIEILALLTLCWTFTLLEPYGLRVRQLIMRHFYPERARARAVWLHNDIRMKRENLLKLFRRFVGISKPIGDRAKVSWIEVLRAKTNRFWLCRKLLGVGDAVRCFLCGETLVEQEDQFIRCSSLDCPCIFCQDCFLRTGNYCSLCMGVLLHESTTSDISFERLERTATVKFDSAT